MTKAVRPESPEGSPTDPAGEPLTALVAAGDGRTAAMIIDAAVRVMSERGYHGTSVRDIAQAADVSTGALYSHFSSKQHLLSVIMNRGLDHLIAASEQALYDAPASPAERLKALIDVHVSRHASHQMESYIGNSELRSLDRATLDLVISKRDTQQRMFDRVIRDGVEQGVFTVADPKMAAKFVVSACTAVANWFRVGGQMSVDELIASYQELALRTLGYQPPN